MDIPFDPQSLAGRALQVLKLDQKLAFAHISPDLEVVQVSANFHELLPEAKTEVIGSSITELVWALVGAEESLAEVLAGERPEYRLERINLPQADGRVHYLNYRLLPLSEGKPAEGLLLIVEDATETGTLEQHLVQDRNELRLVQEQMAQANAELQRLDRLKSLFLSIVAHDLRAPLTSIIGFAELLRAELEPPIETDQEEYLDIISSQAGLLNRLIGDLLDVDQIEQGRLSVFPQACELSAMVSEVSELTAPTARRKELTWTLDLPTSPVIVEADPARLRQILFNLLTNAIKYTQPGGEVAIRVWQEQGNGVFQVADNGQGMSEADLGNLFKLYYRTEDARRSKVTGTGVGLFIVKVLVEAHRGTIEVESRVGEGTTFTVHLPDSPGEDGILAG